MEVYGGFPRAAAMVLEVVGGTADGCIDGRGEGSLEGQLEEDSF